MPRTIVPLMSQPRSNPEGLRLRMALPRCPRYQTLRRTMTAPHAGWRGVTVPTSTASRGVAPNHRRSRVREVSRVIGSTIIAQRRTSIVHLRRLSAPSYDFARHCSISPPRTLHHCAVHGGLFVRFHWRGIRCLVAKQVWPALLDPFNCLGNGSGANLQEHPLQWRIKIWRKPDSGGAVVQHKPEP